MTINVSDFLNMPSGKSVRPVALPIETYSGIITSFERGESRQRKTPLVRFNVRLLDWPASIPESARMQPDGDGVLQPIDLSKKTFRSDFFITEDALFRLDDFLRSCGIEPDGTPYGALCARTIGARVSVEMGQYISESTGEIGNQVNRIYGEVPVRR